MIAALLAIMMASGPLAVTEAGDVAVWRSEVRSWRSIYRCHRAVPMSRRRLAWAGDQLFIACPGEAMASWSPGEQGARPVGSQTLAARRPGLLGSGQRAVYFAERAAVWRYRPALDLVERIGAAPEWPLREIAETPIGLVICGQHRWLWRRGAWIRLKPHSSTRFSQTYPGL